MRYFIRKVQNPSVELQQQFSEVFPSDQTQTGSERIRLQHQRRIEFANQLSRKHELERNNMIQQLNQLDSEFQHDNISPENSVLIPSTSEKVPPQQVSGSELSIPKPFVFHVITERQRRAIITVAISFTENPV